MTTSTVTSVSATLPPASFPLSDPDGTLSLYWYRFFLALWNRTGGGVGTITNDVASTATTAQLAATAASLLASSSSTVGNAAQTTADTALALASAAQTSAATANAGVANLNSTAVLKASFQSDGIAPLSNPVFSGNLTSDKLTLPLLLDCASDIVAAGAGVKVGQFYQTAGVVKQRQT